MGWVRIGQFCGCCDGMYGGGGGRWAGSESSRNVSPVDGRLFATHRLFLRGLKKIMILSYGDGKTFSKSLRKVSVLDDGGNRILLLHFGQAFGEGGGGGGRGKEDEEWIKKRARFLAGSTDGLPLVSASSTYKSRGKM